MKPKHLIMALFFVQALAFGAWLPRIPELQARLGLGPAELALALLGLPIGLVLTIPFAGPIVARLGARLTAMWTMPAWLFAISLPAFSTHIAVLFGTLLVCGIVMSLIELSMNIAADEIETTSGVAIMSRCHGFWSLGMAGGSILSVGLAGLALAPQSSVLSVALVALPFGLWITRALPPSLVHGKPAEGTKTSGLFLPGWLLMGICIVGLASNLLEGAAADWSAVYLTQVFGADAAAAGLGYSAYALLMSVGRFGGDWMRTRWGPVVVARSCYSVALLDIALVVFSPIYWLALFGYALAGFGGSVGVPLAVSAAANAGGRPAAANVAMLTLVSLVGFLVSPPIIGFIAQHAGLRMAIGLLLLPVFALAVLLAPSLRPARK